MADQSFEEAMGEAGQPASSAEALKPLMDLANRAIDLEQSIASIEEVLKAHKSDLHDLKTVRLPDAMVEAGMSSFKTPEGAQIDVADFVSGSLPKEPEKRAKAISILTDAGGEELLKNQITLAFGRSQHNEALALADELRGKGFDAEVKSDVHPQTLMAFVREKIKSGEEVDYEGLGCYVGRVAKIKMPK